MQKREIPKNKPKPPEIRKVEGTGKKAKDFIPEPKPRKMKRFFRWIGNTAAGENKTGETIHGILDLLPIPNQIIAKGASYLLKGKTREAREELDKLLTIRNGIALVVSILIITGVINLEQVEVIVEVLSQL